MKPKQSGVGRGRWHTYLVGKWTKAKQNDVRRRGFHTFLGQNWWIQNKFISGKVVRSHYLVRNWKKTNQSGVGRRWFYTSLLRKWTKPKESGHMHTDLVRKWMRNKTKWSREKSGPSRKDGWPKGAAYPQWSGMGFSKGKMTTHWGYIVYNAYCFYFFLLMTALLLYWCVSK